MCLWSANANVISWVVSSLHLRSQTTFVKYGLKQTWSLLHLWPFPYYICYPLLHLASIPCNIICDPSSHLAPTSHYIWHQLLHLRSQPGLFFHSIVILHCSMVDIVESMILFCLLVQPVLSKQIHPHLIFHV